MTLLPSLAMAHPIIPITTVPPHVTIAPKVMGFAGHSTEGALPTVLGLTGAVFFIGVTYCVLDNCPYWQQAGDYIGFNTYSQPTDYPK